MPLQAIQAIDRDRASDATIAPSQRVMLGTAPARAKLRQSAIAKRTTAAAHRSARTASRPAAASTSSQGRDARGAGEAAVRGVEAGSPFQTLKLMGSRRSRSPGL